MKNADNVLTGVLTLSAVLIAGVVVQREYFGARREQPKQPKAEYVAEWKSVLPAARLSGSPDAPIVLIEFTDIECPFCKRFHASLRKVQRMFPDQVTHAFVHFPLAGHRYAPRAARAAECASAEGRFDAAIDAMFDNQDSLRNEAWPWLATHAGIRNVNEFERCVADTTARPLVLAGQAAGERMGIVGTPTIFLNGWRYPGVPADSELVRAVGDLLAGRKPYKGFPEAAIQPPRQVVTTDH